MIKRVYFFLIGLALFLTLPLLFIQAENPTAPKLLIADYDGAIGPASAEWMSSAIKKANEENVTALIFQLDTPGGLLESTRLLVKDINESSVPIVVYVAPSGARAASAGTFITMSAHVAVMSPGTRIGAAHPVELGKQSDGDMRKKIENDTVSFIKSIADSRNRNAVWAEAAVRKSSSSTEKEALALNVIDFIAKDKDELVKLLHGREVTTKSGPKTIQSKNAVIINFVQGFRVKVLRILTNPNIAYILMMIGIYGILYEFISPGAILPGVAGSICLILGLYALQTLPVNYAGVALLILAVLLFIIESQVVSGLLGVGGMVAMVFGSLLLIKGDYPYMQVSRSLIFSTVLCMGLLLGATFMLVLKVRKQKSVTGAEGMVGQSVLVKSDLSPEGQVLYGGEIWNAESVKGEQLLKGEEAEIVSVNNLKLTVKKKSG